ncbi:hypothetical protein GGR55DRAFT_683448 [Xylaria sp. FL0064]|nr:hypothetical protein GGR55DRAFT_683448 [Xylaria sp. FL0064]
MSLKKSSGISFSQSLFWAVDSVTEGRTTLNHTVLLRIHGDLRVNTLRSAVSTVAQHHEALRTSFLVVNDHQVMQGVLPEPTLKLEEHTISGAAEVQEEYEKLQGHIYDLTKGENMRIRLLKLNSKGNFLLVGFHHINVDGISYQVVISDLCKLCRGQLLSRDTFQYLRYAESQRAEYESGEWKEDIKYWKQEFTTIPEPLPLVRSRVSTRRPLVRYDINAEALRVKSTLANSIREVARTNKATSFHVYLSAFQVLLHRLTGVEDLAIGIADGGRKDGMWDAVGPYLNLLPLRFSVTSRQTFGSVIAETRLKAISALRHSKVPFDVILKELQVQRTSNHSPIFQAFVDYRLEQHQNWMLGSCSLDLVDLNLGKTTYNLSLDIIDDPQGDVRVTLISQAYLYSNADVKIIRDCYEDILGEFVQYPNKQLSGDWQYRHTEVQRALQLGREWPETVMHRLHDAAENNESKIALRHIDGTCMTYSQLLDHPGTKIARLAKIVADCKPFAVLVDAETSNAYPELGSLTAHCVDVGTITQFPQARLSPLTTHEALAMIYYTSGSTGTPKGIAVKHCGLRAVFEGSSSFYGLSPDSITLLQSSLGFDMSLTQLFSAILIGGTACMISRDIRGDALSITEFMIKHNVTHTAGTPSEHSSWLSFGDRRSLRRSSWKAAICGAEPLTRSFLSQFRDLAKADMRLYNIYGTTETTVYATQQELDYNDESLYVDHMPAGHSLPDKSMFVVDEQMRPLPLGLPGEIVLAGAGVAEGYINNSEMTKRSFTQNPYATPYYIEKGWTRIIGDDTEIKLRGFRIDLRDIEQTIITSSEGIIIEAGASLRSNGGTDTQFIVAHIVFHSGKRPTNPDKFLQGLVQRLPLPRYMCPTTIVQVEQMPMMMSGKLDRKALRTLTVNRPDDDTGRAEELGEHELALKDIWQDVLPKGLFAVNADSDFFHVGGTSLLLVILQAKLREAFGVSIRLADLFSYSTLRSMSQLVWAQAETAEKRTIDWELETRPSRDLQPGPLSASNRTRNNPRAILLTGCAGFLGRHLLDSLINHPHVERVYCVAVRQLQKRLENCLIPTHPKVVYMEGDFRFPLLGLSKRDAETVFSEIDAVIHNGADVSHLKSYFTLKRANLGSTKELAGLCLPRRIPFHYISTAGVSMFTFWQSFGEETASAAEPPADSTNGYKASKWASERFLERLNEQTRLPVWLHRPSDMVRQDDEEAKWDLLHTLLGYSRRLKAVPVSENLWGWLDLVDVHRTSNDVVQKVVDNKPRSTTGDVSYVHQTGDIVIPIDEMKEFFEAESGHTVAFEKLPVEEWARRANAAGMHSAVAAVFGNVPRLPRALCFPRFIKTWKPEVS